MHKANLLTLAQYLEQLPDEYPQFEMSRTWGHRDPDRDHHVELHPAGVPQFMATDCGTVACAIGHAPLAGLDPLPDEHWFDYCQRVFGFPFGHGVEFAWLFDPDWSATDNTPRGAAARIRHMIEHGVPKNWEDQIYGRAPLSYQPAKA